MYKQLGFLCLVLQCQALHADDIYLKSASTGRLYGPFQMAEGEVITLGRSEFTVERQPAADRTAPQSPEQRLRTVRLPHVIFRAAAAEDCAAFVQARLAELEPELDFKVIVKRTKAFRPIDGQNMDPFGRTGSASPTEAGVTLSVHEVPAYTVLKEIADQAGGRLKIAGRTVIILL